MLYHWYELGHAAVKPARMLASSSKMFFGNPFNPLSHTMIARHAVAACEVFERTTRRYAKPAFGIETTQFDGRAVAVSEQVVWSKPFCRMIHFQQDVPAATTAARSRILLVAPMSGHFATLLRGTVEALLPNNDVYVTDWLDARDVPISAGSFDLDDYIIYVQDMIRHFAGDVHIFAVCQPSVPVLAAVALLEEDNGPSPHSMILAGGPVDTRVSPTQVNKLAESKGTAWFQRNVTTVVPWPNMGFGRAVYPGFLQLTGFMTMNLDRHVKAHKELFLNLVRGDGDSADKHREFYDEYLAVMDLTAEFYLQTIDAVFVRHALPLGMMTHRGRRVDPKAIRRTALMTIEGEKDDITGIGQCRAAIGLCASLGPDKTYHFEAPGVGHYGVFNGSRFRCDIAPRIEQFVRTHDPRANLDPVVAAIDQTTQPGPAAGIAWGGRPQHDPAAAAFTFSPAAYRD